MHVLLFEPRDETSIREQSVDEHRRASEVEALGVLRDRCLHDAARGRDGVGDEDDLLGARLVHLGAVVRPVVLEYQRAAVERRYQPVDEHRHARLHADFQYVASADVFGEGLGVRLVENEVGERDLYPARRVEVRADVDQLLDQGRCGGIRLAHDAPSRRDQHLHGPGGRPDQRVLPEGVVGDRVGRGDPRADPEDVGVLNAGDAVGHDV